MVHDVLAVPDASGRVHPSRQKVAAVSLDGSAVKVLFPVRVTDPGAR